MGLKEAVMNKKKDSLNYIQKSGEPHYQPELSLNRSLIKLWASLH